MNFMKKAYILSAAALVLGFSACHSDIYGMIQTEVALESIGIPGDISSIVPFDEYLYLSNGNLFRKQNVSSNESGLYNGQWNLVKDADGNQVMKGLYSLASDSTNLYAVKISWTEDESEGENVPAGWTLYTSSDGVSWTELETSDHAMAVFDNQYCAGADNVSNRHAFVRKYDASAEAFAVYSLSGGSVGGAVSGNGADADSIRAVYYNGADYFAPYVAFAATDDYIFYSTAGVKFGDSTSAVFYANQWDSTNGYTVDGESASVDPDAGAVISMAVTSDHLLLGTKSGIRRLPFTESGAPAESAVAFESGNNALSLLTSYVPCIYVRDTSVAEGADDEYASMLIYSYLSSSSDTFKEVGLYSYYKNRAGAEKTWNRDGAAD